MSKILSASKDERVNNIKASVENFLIDISKQERELFTHQEIENILLDIYNLASC